MNIIFVCTGNTCRSPMAEYYLKSKNLNNINVSSRGFSSGEPANPNSIVVMQEVNIDISNHISNIITTNDVNFADAIICMTESHKQLLTSTFGTDTKMLVLENGIPDPFGCDVDAYRKCRDKIFLGIDNLISNGFFTDINIAPATLSDVTAIANIEKDCFYTPWSENAINESMCSGTSFYVARLNNEIVGYMGLSKIAGEGYVTNIAVLSRYRQRGVGKKILKYVIENSKNELEFISLEVRVSNKTAISLYEHFGFETVGLRKRFYTNPQEDALIMTKNFI